MAETSEPFRNVEYRKVIAWSARMEREWPFLQGVLSPVPERSILDVGCGTGEHAALLYEKGFTVLGVDASEEQIAAARDHERLPDLRFQQIDFAADGVQLDASYGAAVSLGNVLPFLEDEPLRRMLANTRRALVDGGVLVFQILNYARILDGSFRHMPLSFVEDPEGEVVFARIFRAAGPRHVVFRPTSLLLPDDPEADLTLRATRSIRTRAWQREELLPLLREAGFAAPTWFGGVDQSAFDPRESQDLIGVTRTE